MKKFVFSDTNWAIYHLQLKRKKREGDAKIRLSLTQTDKMSFEKKKERRNKAIWKNSTFFVHFPHRLSITMIVKMYLND